jgi:hypothetical protein
LRLVGERERGSDVAGVKITIPGSADVVETKAALLRYAVEQQFANLSPMAPVPGTATPDANADKVRRPSAGDLGKRLSTVGLA